MIGPDDVQTGEPRERGRYLIFLRCASLQIQDWAEPSICNWSGKWETWAASRVVGWIGPIAPMKVLAIFGMDKSPPADPPAYDL